MGCGCSASNAQSPERQPPCQKVALGVVRLDYSYPAAPGDIDHPESHGFPVIYRVVPGLTFEMAQKGVLTKEVEKRFVAAIRFLEAQGVCGITGDCGFMMYFQKLARQNTKLPVFMSALAQLPAVTCGFAKNELIAILTANGKSLEPMKPLIKDECGVDADETRYVIVGCEDIPGFEAVALGQKVDVAKVTPGIIDKVRQLVKQYSGLRGICLECTELPPYADAIRAATGLPVFDAITCCELFVSGLQDNPYFGLDGWQAEWDGVQKEYHFGQHLNEEDKAQLVDQPGLPTLSKSANQQSAPNDVKQLEQCICQVASLGVIRLDYDYPAAKGDIAHPGSHGYPVIYRVVPGLTFEMAQTGFLTEDVEKRFVEAIHFLEAQGVCGITGDCGFMMYFQKLARQNTKLPVFMSSLAHLPAVTCGFAKNELIAILTANGKSLESMKPLVKHECGVDADETRYVIVGCEDIPGFEAVALGQKVDVEKVTPGITHKVQQVIKKHPQIRAICLECTELPPYADAIRAACGLPVYDAITNCAFFISGHKDNPRFGLNNWRASWDGKAADYKFGANLTAEDKEKLVNKDTSLAK